jgi:hypothetical protein
LNISGAAAFPPIIFGRPSPSAFPTHTPTTYFPLMPIDQASLKPKLVPVLVKKLNTKKILIGYDHRFGKGRKA